MEDKEGKRTNPPTSGCSRLSARTRCVYGNGNSAQTHQNGNCIQPKLNACMNDRGVGEWEWEWQLSSDSSAFEISIII